MVAFIALNNFGHKNFEKNAKLVSTQKINFTYNNFNTDNRPESKIFFFTMLYFFCRPQNSAIYQHIPTNTYIYEACHDDASNDIKRLFPSKYFVNHGVIYGLHATFD